MRYCVLAAMIGSLGLGSAESVGGDKPPPIVRSPMEADQVKQIQRQWAEYLDRPVVWTNSIGLKMVLIPPGEYLMGSTQAEIDALLPKAEKLWSTRNRDWFDLWAGWLKSEAPRHRVRITRPFYLGATEITVGQFRRFVEATGYQPAVARPPTPKQRRGKFPQLWIRGTLVTPPSEECPASCISWTDAVAFCDWMNEHEERRGDASGTDSYRLPTEAEWEYACRAGTQTPWFFGDDFRRITEYAQVGQNLLRDRLYVVGRKKPNPFGLYDMLGGVYEWCSDWFAGDYYSRSPTVDPPGPAKAKPTYWPERLPILDPGLDRVPDSRVVRGGAFNFSDPLRLRSAHRIGLGTTGGHWHLGFRVARTISDTPEEKSP